MLSYRRPHGRTIELALGRLPAADPARRVGSLFWNPGGPGGSGKIPPPFSDALHERFDLVGFDPRGIAESTPLRCFESNEQVIELFGLPFPITRAQERDAIARSVAGTEQCARNGGPIMSHMATGNVARDLDLLRQAAGDRRLTYPGFSYRTHIGELYANLFPRRVRALTLDAVIDPVEWTTGRCPRSATSRSSSGPVRSSAATTRWSPCSRRARPTPAAPSARAGAICCASTTAVSTQRRMGNARLLTLDSFGHTAFGQSQCVVTAVERYLIAVELPARGAVCRPDREPFDPPPELTEAERALAEAVGP